MKSFSNIIFSFLFIFSLSCQANAAQPETKTPQLIMGAEKIGEIRELTQGKNVALIINQTSVVGENMVHLLDTLLAEKVAVKKVFAPEHGFRGDADAGETVLDGKDKKTGIPIISLYGKNKKPTPEQLKDVDVIIFDIQDVGARFYTYISTMAYAMQAAGENNKKFIVLDRPNPNDYVEGPVLKKNCRSFVGLLPIPVLHGMTVGELALMINGEKWLGNNWLGGEKGECDLTVIGMDNWKHGMPYSLPVKPSPNLPNDVSIRLYPSLCLFEGTEVSVGRGTYFPFQVIGYPDKNFGEFTFTPKSLPGFDKNPLQKDKVCYGIDLRKDTLTSGFSLAYFIDFYNKSGKKADFISRKQFFNLLMGDKEITEMIVSGKSEEEIREKVKPELDKYKTVREKYLLY